MKKIIIYGVFALGLMVFNISQRVKSNDAGLNIDQLAKMNIADAECTTPQWLFGSCNQKIESINSTCTIVTVTRTFRNSGGSIVGVGIVTAGTVTMSWGYETGIYSDQTTSQSYVATRVNCPTNGTNNDCEEYNPCF